MSSSDAQQIEELKKELEEMKSKNEKLAKEMQQVKDEMNAKNKNLEKQLRDLKDQQCVNFRCRCRRNLPAELKVEIVDCFPVENAVHFLANVPNRLIIHHCAPRIRRILKMIEQIIIGFARTLRRGNSDGYFYLENGHKYTPEMDIFVRYGAAHCRDFTICGGPGPGYDIVGYPTNFFDDLIKYYYKTKAPTKTIRDLYIELPLENPAPWPAALVQPQAGEMNVKEVEVDNAWKYVRYILRNKHNPGIEFTLWIWFEEDSKCYKQMTSFSSNVASRPYACRCGEVDYDNKMVVYTLRNKHNPGVGFKLSVHFEGKVKCYQKMTRFTAQVVPM